MLGGNTVWLLSLEELSEADLEELYARLSPARKTKAEQIRAEMKKRQSVGAGYLLYLLKKRFSIEEDPVFMPGGKPVFSPEAGICFNISHSGPYAAIAFGKRALGLDIECAKRADLKMAKRFFKEEEYEHLAGLEQGEREDAFCKIWTGKEAILKATGTGLSVPLNSFSVLDTGENAPEKSGEAVEPRVCLAGDRYGLYQRRLTEKGSVLWVSLAVLHEL